MSRNRSESPSQRTDEERARAREERERRRHEKDGGEPPRPPLPPPARAVEIEQVEPLEAAIEPVEHPVQEAEQIDLSAQQAAPVALPPDPSTSPTEASALPLDPRTPLGPLPPRKRFGARPHRPHRAHRPHLSHRPHLPRRRQPSRVRTGMARAGAVLALLIVLAALGGAAALLLRHHKKPKPVPAPAIVKVTIPEGYTRAQIAALAKADGLEGSYLAASKSSPELRLSHYHAPKRTSTLEGFLFPATYEMYKGASASQLVSKQLAAFTENFGEVEARRAKALGITPYQLLIVASIIEREVEIPHDRPLVAAVIYNRLRLNMTLGIDSTLRYALHDFTHPLTESELHSDSPYNTRVHRGLPPTPIANPGVSAIKAAARPAHVSYLYYVSGADGCGEQVFSTEYAQFEKDVAAYKEALSRNGGRVPRCKEK